MTMKAISYFYTEVTFSFEVTAYKKINDLSFMALIFAPLPMNAAKLVR